MRLSLIFKVLFLVLIPSLSFAQGNALSIGSVRIEFILFGLTLLGVALFHDHTLKVALAGLAAILILKLGFTDFHLISHIMHEWDIFVNLFGLLIGFAILARHFEESGIPQILPDYLPDDWKGGFFLLVIVFILSGFLDNIAAAMIGGTIALTVYKGKVHIGFLAAIVAASNAGGSGSFLGDTTTTMMWIAKKPIGSFIKAYIGALPALIVFGILASIQQDRYNRIVKDADAAKAKVEYSRLLAVLLILFGAIVTMILWDLPAFGVWGAIIVASFFTKTDWKEAKHAIPGAIFLLSLVMAASMMPVNDLPPASWASSFALGFISAVFDNIPLTKLALEQGGYDWGVLAFAVGYGGSMVWFGSSAGVALSNIFPEARSVFNWIKYGWHVIIAYIIGFFILLGISGWDPEKITQKQLRQIEQRIGH